MAQRGYRQSRPIPINTIPAADYVTSAATFNFVIPGYNPATADLVPDVGNQIFGPSPPIPASTRSSSAPARAGSPFPATSMPAVSAGFERPAFQHHQEPSCRDQSGDRHLHSRPAAICPSTVREDLFRIDHNINDKWSLFGHFIHDAMSQTTPPSVAGRQLSDRRLQLQQPVLQLGHQADRRAEAQRSAWKLRSTMTATRSPSCR